MSRENEAEREDSEGMGRGQCFPCLFSKFEVAGDSLIMRKKNWMMISFSVRPWEGRDRRFLDIDAFPCIWSLNFLSPCFKEFCVWDFDVKIQNLIRQNWYAVADIQQSSSKSGSVDVYQTVAWKTICYFMLTEGDLIELFKAIVQHFGKLFASLLEERWEDRHRSWIDLFHDEARARHKPVSLA